MLNSLSERKLVIAPASQFLEPFAGLASAPWLSWGTDYALGTSSTLLPACFAHLCPRAVRWTGVRSLALGYGCGLFAEAPASPSRPSHTFALAFAQRVQLHCVSLGSGSHPIVNLDFLICFCTYSALFTIQIINLRTII